MDAIKELILHRHLRPGDPLPSEAQIGAVLGVSRSSVREALRKLEALDIVRVEQGRGSFVGEMSLEPLVETLVLRYAVSRSSGRDSMRDVVEMRRIIDLGVAPQLVAEAEGKHNAELAGIVGEMVTKSERGELYFEEDRAFHSNLYASIDNRLIQQFSSALWFVHQTFIPTLDTGSREALAATAEAHQRMLETAEAGDLSGYIAAVEDHYAPLVRLLDEEE